jgi:hypothetical protein
VFVHQQTLDPFLRLCAPALFRVESSLRSNVTNYGLKLACSTLGFPFCCPFYAPDSETPRALLEPAALAANEPAGTMSYTHVNKPASGLRPAQRGCFPCGFCLTDHATSSSWSPVFVTGEERVISVSASDGRTGEQRQVSYTTSDAIVGNGSFGVVVQVRILARNSLSLCVCVC